MYYYCYYYYYYYQCGYYHHYVLLSLLLLIYYHHYHYYYDFYYYHYITLYSARGHMTNLSWYRVQQSSTWPRIWCFWLYRSLHKCFPTILGRQKKLKSLWNPYKAGIEEEQDLFVDDLEAPTLRRSSADTSPKLSPQELFVCSHGSTESCICVDCGLCRGEHPLFHQRLVYLQNLGQRCDCPYSLWLLGEGEPSCIRSRMVSDLSNTLVADGSSSNYHGFHLVYKGTKLNKFK